MTAKGDDDLLARLNALKPTSVTLNENPTVIDVHISRPETVEDKLADRLKKLRSGATSHVGSSAGIEPKSPPRAAPSRSTEAAVLSDPHDAFQHDYSVDDLLAELGTSSQWFTNTEEHEPIDALLKEARDALPRETAATTKTNSEGRDKVTSSEQDRPEPQDEDIDDRSDEDLASEVVTKILAEVALERSNDEDFERKDSPDKANGTGGVDALDLPSTPSHITLHSSENRSDPPSYEDSELAARFWKLGLDLPSTPTSEPRAKPKQTPKSNSSKARYTDNEIDSWCCICNEDGEVKCIGCDNDIYCQSCWSEGHGNGPGQERGHRALQFTTKGPAAVA